MIIPVRCFTCNHVIGDKWEYYKRETEHLDKDDASAAGKKTRAEVLDELGLKRICCRRHFLGHVDMMDKI